MPRRALLSSALCLMPLTVIAPAAFAQAPLQATFTRLGVLPAGSPVTSAHRLSRDGRAVSGHAASGSDMFHIRWSEMDGLVKTAQTQTVPWGYQWTGISATGRYEVGGVLTPTGSIEAYRWSVANGLEILGDLPGGPKRTLAFAVSEDGSIVAGGANATYDYPTFTSQPFRWTQATGLVGLGWSKPGHDWGEVWAMTPDGSTMVGASGKYFVEFHGFIWTQATGMVDLGDLPGHDDYSPAFDVTPDGKVVVGVCSPAAGYEAYRWTQATGMVPLGDLPGGEHYSGANGVSADGNIIVGVADWDGGFGDEKAFIWDPVNGMRDLQAVLQTEYNVDLSGWHFTGAAGISDDGAVIIGDGVSPEGHVEAWMVKLPKAGCPADLNGDGIVDFADYLEFLNLFDMGC